MYIWEVDRRLESHITPWTPELFCRWISYSWLSTSRTLNTLQRAKKETTWFVQREVAVSKSRRCVTVCIYWVKYIQCRINPRCTNVLYATKDLPKMAKILIMLARECLKCRNTYTCIVCDWGIPKNGKNTNYVSQGMSKVSQYIHMYTRGAFTSARSSSCETGMHS